MYTRGVTVVWSIGMLPSPTLLTDQYRDETNGCYVPYCRHRNGTALGFEWLYVRLLPYF